MREEDLRRVSPATNPDIDAAGFTAETAVRSIVQRAPANPPEKPEGFSVVGKSLPKVDAYGKVTGAAKFADDIFLPRMLHGKLLRSTLPHAVLKKVDCSRALALPGVVAVASGPDLPVRYGILPSSPDETVFAIEKVRYVGDPIAAVVADDELTAEEALELIDVEYEPLPAVMTIDAALRDDLPRIHDNPRRTNNVHKEVHLEFGDMAAGFAQADRVFEDEYFFEGNTHAPMEEHSVVADYDPDDKLTIWASTQTPHYLHRIAAQVLAMPASRIRVIAPPVGGGFGGKTEPFAHELAAAHLSRATGRPVKITLTRQEVFYAHRGRHPVRMKLKTGVKSDGTITACHLQTWLDGGAYGSYGVATTYYTGALATVTYKIPAYKFDGCRVLRTSRRAARSVVTAPRSHGTHSSAISTASPPPSASTRPRIASASPSIRTRPRSTDCG